MRREHRVAPRLVDCAGVVFMVLAALGTLATAARAQAPPTPLSVKPLSGGVYWTQGGSGGNTGIIVGQHGVFVVDAKTTPDSAKEVLAEIAKITPKPITHVLITHSDADHVNGLAAFPRDLTIIAQENCRNEMEASLNNPRNPAPREYLPNRTIDKNETLTIDGVRVQLLHVAPAHTSGDMIVYLPQQKIVFTGDIVGGQPYPLIHLEKNGSSAGWIATMKKMVTLNANTFVAGHGNLQTKADLEKQLARVQERRAEIKLLIEQGKSLDQIRAMLGEPTTPPAAAPGAPQFPTFTEVVYKELSKS